MNDKRIVSTPEEFREVLRECKERVGFYLALAERKLSIALPMPIIRFDIKGTKGGTAQFNPRNPAQSIIRFNPTLLRENIEHFLQQTVGHETAHLIARAKHGDIDPHGAEWRRVMWAFSLPANRCHNYDVSTVPSMLGKVARRPANPVTIIEGGKVHFAKGCKVIEFD